MGEFELWFYRGVIGIAVLIVGFGVKMAISMGKEFVAKVMDKFDILIEAINTLSGKNIAQEEQIKALVEQHTDHSKRLNDHGERIRKVEIEHAKGCKIAK